MESTDPEASLFTDLDTEGAICMVASFCKTFQPDLDEVEPECEAPEGDAGAEDARVSADSLVKIFQPGRVREAGVVASEGLEFAFFLLLSVAEYCFCAGEDDRCLGEDKFGAEGKLVIGGGGVPVLGISEECRRARGLFGVYTCVSNATGSFLNIFHPGE